ncbi:FAD/NAD(P)-binding domain-containing protein [Auriculariales sp. MPI-PUGE-AT-0066]|nr:FAD/NAD(P)-binding domain-containing protein [Auriculariales sp. MPI-PUGE-AT-0066]
MAAAPLPSSSEVVIVGAGPSGLACALGLAFRNIPFVLVDAREGGHSDSRAVLVQANALETLEALDPDISNEIVALGIKSESLTTLDVQERPVFCLRMSDNAPYTKYGFSLLIGQHHIERILRDHLARRGHQVQYHQRVTDVTQGPEGWSVEFLSGQRIVARYVVAADGSKSLVRSRAGIPFLNPYTNAGAASPTSNDLSFVVADVQLADPLPSNIPRDRLQMMVGLDGVVLTAPLLDAAPPNATDPTGGNLFRLYLGIPDTPPAAPTVEYVQNILDTRGPGSHSKQHTVPRIARMMSSSRFRTRPALADRYVQRASGSAAYVLLIGDAAHKHGPAGGQGMNMGVCDGVELAEAIDAHRGVGGEKAGAGQDDDTGIFQAYSTRRRAIARETIDMVEGMTQLEKGGAGWVPWLRVMGLWLFFKVPGVNGMLAWKVSGLQHRKK